MRRRVWCRRWDGATVVRGAPARWGARIGALGTPIDVELDGSVAATRETHRMPHAPPALARQGERFLRRGLFPSFAISDS